MKSRIILIALVLSVLLPLNGFAQLKSNSKMPDFTSILSQPVGGFFDNLLDPSKFHMSHSFTMSFGMAGGAQMLQNSYVNTMFFQLSDNMRLTTNLGVMATPYHTFGNNSYLNKPVFFGGAQLDYKISDNTRLMFRIESSPYNNYYGYNRFDNRSLWMNNQSQFSQ